MRNIIAAGVLLLGTMCVVHGQPTQGLLAYYSFDGCDAFDDTGNGADGVLMGGPGCECGVSGNALRFDGVDDYVSFLGSFDLLFAGDFTISFHLLPENPSGVIDILSKKQGCTFDKSIGIRLESASRTVRAELSESITARGENKSVLADEVCWQHIAWVRNGFTLYLYVNGVLVSTENTPGVIDANNNGVFSIANSPCLANGEQRLSGRIDELRLYNRALSTAEVSQLYIPMDQIVTPDAFIFDGESLQIELTNSCAEVYSWNPPNGVVTPGSAEPLITPVQTTTYEVTMSYSMCAATDTIRIVLLDSTQVDCNDVFVPNAFTPNGDQLNDEFGISNKFFLGQFIALEVYDRWGTQLFRGTTPDDKWDGSYQGQDVIPDMYLYKLYFNCNGAETVRAGGFALIK